MFALWAVLMNSLGWRCTSEITPINPQLQYQTAHCSLALKRSVSFRNEELHARKRTDIWKTEKLSIYLARLYPSQSLRTRGQVESEGSWPAGRLKSLSLELWTRLQKRLEELKSWGSNCPRPLFKGWYWRGQEFKCDSSTELGRIPFLPPGWSLHILITCF